MYATSTLSRKKGVSVKVRLEYTVPYCIVISIEDKLSFFKSISNTTFFICVPETLFYAFVSHKQQYSTVQYCGGWGEGIQIQYNTFVFRCKGWKPNEKVVFSLKAVFSKNPSQLLIHYKI